MIKFFRKVRQKLLTENKFTKYLLYAIGEILLVVIGILIALQINNNNEDKKARQKEILLLTEMRTNLEDDLSDLNYNIKYNKRRTHYNEVIKNVIEQKLPFHDTLKPYFGKFFGNFQLTENTSAWENLKSIGLDLISNDTLRNNMSYLYSSRYQYLENLEKSLDDRYQWDFLYPQILKHIKVNKLWGTAEPRNYEELLTDHKFIEVVKMNITFRNYMQNEYEKNHEIVSGLLEQIDRHLAKLNS